MFENLNIAGTVWASLKHFLEQKHSNLVKEYRKIYSDSIYWDIAEEEIKEYCNQENLDCRLYFHHK